MAGKNVAAYAANRFHEPSPCLVQVPSCPLPSSELAYPSEQVFSPFVGNANGRCAQGFRALVSCGVAGEALPFCGVASFARISS